MLCDFQALVPAVLNTIQVLLIDFWAGSSLYFISNARAFSCDDVLDRCPIILPYYQTVQFCIVWERAQVSRSPILQVRRLHR